MAFLLATSCGATGRPLPDVATELNATYHPAFSILVPGDALSLSFAQRAEWNHDTRIGLDGKASFRGLGELQAAGRTREELGVELQQRYSKILSSPEITLFLTEPAPRRVMVVGEVTTPGEILLDTAPLNLIEALNRTGGHRHATADLKRVQLVRLEPERNALVSWNLDARTEYWEHEPPILLQPWDMVFVPPKTVVKVNVWIDQYIRQMIPLPSWGGTGFY